MTRYEVKGSPNYKPSGMVNNAEARHLDESYYWDKAANDYYHAICAQDHGRYAGTMRLEGRHAICQRCGRRLEVAIKFQAGIGFDEDGPSRDAVNNLGVSPGTWLQLNPNDTVEAL